MYVQDIVTPVIAMLLTVQFAHQMVGMSICCLHYDADILFTVSINSLFYAMKIQIAECTCKLSARLSPCICGCTLVQNQR